MSADLNTTDTTPVQEPPPPYPQGGTSEEGSDSFWHTSWRTSSNDSAYAYIDGNRTVGYLQPGSQPVPSTGTPSTGNEVTQKNDGKSSRRTCAVAVFVVVVVVLAIGGGVGYGIYYAVSLSTSKSTLSPAYVGSGNTSTMGSMNVAVNGEWSTWSGYTPCSVTCGDGVQIRVRTCTSPVPQFGGSGCSGDTQQTTNCTVLSACPVVRGDCTDVQSQGGTTDGVYTVYPSTMGGQPVQVYCDMATSGGGWLVFQRRKNGATDFYLDWTTYATGFGSLTDEFWFGNEKLHAVTSQKAYTLRVDMTSFNATVGTAYAEYSNFTVASVENNYKMSYIRFLGGAAGDSLKHNKGNQFTTKDNDHDTHSDENCAVRYHGAWWYDKCGWTNLNGQYSSDPVNIDGTLWWYPWDPEGPLSCSGCWSKPQQYTSMMIRPTV